MGRSATNSQRSSRAIPTTSSHRARLPARLYSHLDKSGYAAVIPWLRERDGGGRRRGEQYVPRMLGQSGNSFTIPSPPWDESGRIRTPPGAGGKQPLPTSAASEKATR